MLFRAEDFLRNDARLQLAASIEQLPLKAPFTISGYTFTEAEAVVVKLTDGAAFGRGEASGVYYLKDEPAGMLATIEAHRGAIEAGITRAELQTLLPPGGARNALDCALWELESTRTGRPVWELAGQAAPRSLITTFTVGADTPEAMAKAARDYVQALHLKLKLTGDAELDAERVRAVRAARPDAWIGVDGNQGFTRASIEQLLPVLVEAQVSLLEQPLRRGDEASMDGFKCPIPLAADESVQGLDEVAALVGRFNVVNIKLDKCGGLTEGLAIAAEAKRLGMRVMVGNMLGSSWAMAPSFVLGQLCDFVDLDGPVFLGSDRTPALHYADGRIHSAGGVWGGF